MEADCHFQEMAFEAYVRPTIAKELLLNCIQPPKGNLDVFVPPASDLASSAQRPAPSAQRPAPSAQRPALEARTGIVPRFLFFLMPSHRVGHFPFFCSLIDACEPAVAWMERSVIRGPSVTTVPEVTNCALTGAPGFRYAASRLHDLKPKLI